MMRYEAVIFDLDGTLLDTLGDLAASTNRALAHFGLPQRSLEEVRQFVGNGVEKLIRRAVPTGTSEGLHVTYEGSNRPLCWHPFVAQSPAGQWL